MPLLARDGETENAFYMRRLAQQRADRIIETTPNGIVILDKTLHIISMNPAFQKMFMCNNNIIGKHISYLLDSDNYEKLASGAGEQFEYKDQIRR